MSQSSHVPPVVEMMVETAQEAFCVLDLDLRVLALNEYCCELLALTRDALLGQHFYECASNWDEPLLRDVLETTLPRQKQVRGVRIQKREGGTERIFEVNGRLAERDEVIVLAIADVTDRGRTVRELGRQNERLQQRERELSREVLELHRLVRRIEQEERRRISEVLHDDLQQRLYGIGLQTTLARRRIDAEQPAAADEHLARIEGGVEECIHILRSMAVDLSPPVVLSESLASTMEWLSSRMEQLYNLSVAVQVESGISLAEDTRELLYKVCRELLFNVVKHAGVLEATVDVRQADDFVELTVADRGSGFDAQQVMKEKTQPTGLGLFSLEQRLRGFGGSLAVESVLGEGTRILIRLPIRA